MKKRKTKEVNIFISGDFLILFKCENFNYGYYCLLEQADCLRITHDGPAVYFGDVGVFPWKRSGAGASKLYKLNRSCELRFWGWLQNCPWLADSVSRSRLSLGNQILGLLKAAKADRASRSRLSLGKQILGLLQAAKADRVPLSLCMFCLICLA